MRGEETVFLPDTLTHREIQQVTNLIFELVSKNPGWENDFVLVLKKNNKIDVRYLKHEIIINDCRRFHKTPFELCMEIMSLENKS